MKKIKNIKVMLIGLFVMMGMNAFAQATYKTDSKAWYEVVDPDARTVYFMGVSMTQAASASITVDATVELQDDNLNNQTWTVIGVRTGWWDGTSATSTSIAGKVRDLTASPNVVKNLTFKFRTDGDIDLTDAASYEAVSVLGANLETLAIEGAHKCTLLPKMDPTTYPKLKKIDFSKVSNDGYTIGVAADFVKGQGFLEEVKLPEAKMYIGGSAFEGVHGWDATKSKPTPTSITNIKNAIKIWDSAFKDAYVENVEIGSDLFFMGVDAFAASSTATAYLTKVTWNTNELTGGDPLQPWIPAVFKNQDKIHTVIVNADKVQYFEAGAFVDAAPVDANGKAIPFTLDLEKAKAFNTLSGTIPNIPYGKLALANTALKAETDVDGDKDKDLDDILGFTLATKSQNTLWYLTLPEGLESLSQDEFNGYDKLSTIGINMANIPDNAFRDATSLSTLDLGANVRTIGAYAFYNTSLSDIIIPGGVTSIGDFAFAKIAWQVDGVAKTHKPVKLDLTAATSLASIGTSSFEDTNISPDADFRTTQVTVIPEKAFYKSNFATLYNQDNEANFLEKVYLKEAPANKKAAIQKSAFENNEKLNEVVNLNQANYDFELQDDGLTPKAGKDGIFTKAFKNTGLKKVELDGTPITVIATDAFSGIEALETVALNAATVKICDNAFANDYSLGTVTNLGNDKLVSIGDEAFAMTAQDKLDFSKATSLSSIGKKAFSAIKYKKSATEEVYKPTLTTVTFPKETADPTDVKNTFKEKYSNKIQTIGAGAFLYQKNVTALNNLADTKITTLEQLFSDNNPNDIDLKASPALDQTQYCPAGLTTIELPNTEWFDKDNSSTPIVLEKIDHYALQGLGIESIVIPSTVEYFGGCVLQGCLDLTYFEFNDCAPKYPFYDGSAVDWKAGPGLHKYTFRGNSNLEECYFMTSKQIAPLGLTDDHFYWCSKDKLQVYVTGESLLQLRADGYTTANAKYSKLNDTMVDEYTFSENGYNEVDKYYYATYYKDTYSTWFDADEVEVFTAIVKGNQIVMVPAETEEDAADEDNVKNYYKIGSYDKYSDKGGVAIIRSKKQTVKMNLMAVPGNNKTTLVEGQNDLQVTFSEIPVSKLTFQFKLGKNKKTGAVGFFRIKTGTFKGGSVFIQATSPARFADFIDINGNATGIKTLEAVENEDGAIYNLQGIRVNETQKGMYIKNGKKFIVK